MLHHLPISCNVLNPKEAPAIWGRKGWRKGCGDVLVRCEGLAREQRFGRGYGISNTPENRLAKAGKRAYIQREPRFLRVTETGAGTARLAPRARLQRI